MYASGLAGVLLVQAFVRQPMPSGAQASAAPWWAWSGGLISIAATFAGVMLAQKLGSGIFTGISITASVVISLGIDHFGLLGVRQHAASPLRMAGAVLMIAGVWMISRF